MDGLEELIAPYDDKVIGGKKYRLHYMTLNDWVEATKLLKAGRPTAIEAVKPHLRDLDPDSRDKLLSLAWRDDRDGDLIAQYDVERWVETPIGRIYRFWFMLRKAQPEITLEQSQILLQTMNEEDSAALLALEKEALGEPKGNAEGPESSEQETPVVEATGETPSAV